MVTKKAKIQYRAYDKEDEQKYTSLSDPDPLGTPNFELPGQVNLNVGVELESDGYRIGWPKDSHCDEGKRDGRLQ